MPTNLHCGVRLLKIILFIRTGRDHRLRMTERGMHELTFFDEGSTQTGGMSPPVI
jgi:hypothetical protein